MFPSIVFAAVLGAPQCWDIFDAALRRSAAAAHPAYISYNERITITADQQPLLYSSAHVDYRDDGVSRVEDERFDYRPFLTRSAEPGPPELGPYGPARIAWLPQEYAYPVITNVRSQGDTGCRIVATEFYKGHRTYHLVFPRPSVHEPRVKEMWVDTTSYDIWKLTVLGPVYFVDLNKPPLTEFQVELEYAGPYLVVDHVVWSYQRREFSQASNFFGEYTLSGFTFPQTLPGSYFGDAQQR